MKKITLGYATFGLFVDEYTGLTFATIKGTSEKVLQVAIFDSIGCEVFDNGFDGGSQFYTKQLDENSWIAKIFLLDIKLLSLSEERKINILKETMKKLYNEIWD